MKKFVFSFYMILLGILLFPESSYSQSSFLERFEFGVSGGLALPIGVFSDVHVASSLEQLDQYRWIRGFVKESGGQAIKGTSINLDLKYYISPKVFISLSYIRNHNQINTQPQQDYYDENSRFITDEWGNEREFPGYLSSEDYSLNAYLLALGYRFPVKKFDFSVAGQIGRNSLQFPFYVWAFGLSDQISLLLRPRGVYEPLPTNMEAVSYGLQFNGAYPITNRLKTNLNLSYLRSDHPHSYWTTTLGASNEFFIEDNIKYRVLALRLGLSYSLNSINR